MFRISSTAGIVVLVLCLLLSKGFLMARSYTVERIADNLVFPEGPVWVPEAAGGYLLFSDVHGATIQKLLPGGGSETWFSRGKKTNGLILSHDGKKIYACCYSEFELLEIDIATREFRVLADNFQGRRFNNVNDVALDADGNVYFTDPKWGAKEGDPQGIYCVTADGQTTMSAQLEMQPNGILVSHDQKLVYATRSGAHDVWVFDRAGRGALVNGRQFCRLESEPDGMTHDSKGNLYIALAGNGKLCIVSPEGEILQTIPLMERMTTNCEFEGGSDSVLYVTGGGKKDSRIGGVWRIRFTD